MENMDTDIRVGRIISQLSNPFKPQISVYERKLVAVKAKSLKILFCPKHIVNVIDLILALIGSKVEIFATLYLAAEGGKP